MIIKPDYDEFFKHIEVFADSNKQPRIVCSKDTLDWLAKYYWHDLLAIQVPAKPVDGNHKWDGYTVLIDNNMKFGEYDLV